MTEFKDDEITTVVSYGIYKNSSIESIDLPNAISLGTYAFSYNPSLRSASFSSLQTIPSSGFYENRLLETINFPNVNRIESNAFYNCASLKSMNFPLATYVGSSAFYGCNSADSVSFPLVQTVGGSAFYNVPVKRITLPRATSLGPSINAYYGAAEVELGTAISSIPSSCFSNAYNMVALILRKETVVSLQNANAFTDSSIQSGYGWIYVPNALVNTYKSATNWANFANQIVSIDEYPKPIQIGTISDTWEQIFAAEADETYTNKYHVGDTKLIDVDGTPVLMQIIAMDADELADNSGNAKITWLCKGFYAQHYMNLNNVTTGGWLDCNMRSYLRESVFPKIDSIVRSNIKEVKKTYRDYTSNSTKMCIDSIWIPSRREMFGGTACENSGVIYSGAFPDNSSRIKYPRFLGTSASSWWLRSASSSTYFYSVYNGGYSSSISASNSSGVVFGFCT